MLKEFLLDDSLKLVGAIYDKKELRGADYVIIATPTNYNKHTHRLDTKIVEGVIYDFFENNKKRIEIIIYEPFLKSKSFRGCKVVESLNELKKLSDVVIANRYSKELDDVKEMVYTRDVFTKD